MSTQFLLKDITNEQQSVIANDLNLKQISNDSQSQSRKFKGRQRFPKNKKLNVFMEKDDILYLPFHYVKENVGIVPNSKVNHSLLKSPFKGKLWPSQISVYEEALKDLKNEHTTILNLHPGFGKTVLGTSLACSLGYKTIFMIAGTPLIKGWKGTITKMVPDATVWIVGNKKPKNHNIAICMIGRIGKIPPEELLEYGTLVIDECHMFCTQNRIEKLLSIRPKNIIALSATFKRWDDGFHRAIELIAGTKKIVRRYEGNLSIYRYATDLNIQYEIKNGMPDWQDLRLQISQNDKRNDDIANMCSFLVKKGYKIVVFTWLNENHVKPLYEKISKQIKKVSYYSGSKSGYDDADVLIGTIGKIGTGFDEKEMCNNFGGIRLNLALIVGSLKSISLLEQMVGRILRSINPTVIHYVDRDNISQKHWRGCLPYYREVKVTINRVKVINDKNIPNYSDIAGPAERKIT